MKKQICILFYFLLSAAFSFSQNAEIDSLLMNLKEIKTDTTRISKLNDISEWYWMSGDYTEGKKYANEALLLSAKVLSEDLTTEKTIKSVKKNQATAYSNLGIISAQLGNYPEALKYGLSVLKIREEMGNKMGMAVAYGNIGTIYYLQKNYIDARKNLFLSLKLNKETGNTRGLASTYGSLGTIYWDEGDLDEALKNYAEALRIMKEVKNDQGVASCYNNMGLIYEKQKKYPEAIKNYLASLKIKEEIGDNDGAASSYINLGLLNVNLQKKLEGRAQIEKGLSIGKKIRSKGAMEEAYLALAHVDSVLGKYESSLGNYKLYILYRDSLNNEESIKKTVQVQMQYDFNKKQATDSIKNIEQAKQESLKHSQEIHQQKIYTYGGAVGFILMLVVAGISFRAFKNKQKANEIIEHQKELVEEKQKEILDSIHYAKRIQQSLLPTEKYIQKKFTELKK